MLSLRKYSQRLKQGAAENKFVANLGWLGVSEVVVRVTRLLTAIVLARVLDPMAFGIAALVLTINELIRVFSRNGIGAKIIQCEEEDLEGICNTAYRLNMVFCIVLFILQALIAYPVAAWYQSPELIPMIQVLALTYLLMPFGMVHAALVQREQRMKVVAAIDGGQVSIDNILTAILALTGMGAWAIVLPKFLTSPIWVWGYRCSISWRPQNSGFKVGLWREVLHFGKYYLSIEVLKTARLNLDNMIIGRVLGIEVLGIYYFARNAGLGFSLTLINAVNAALYPNLCEVGNQADLLKQRFQKNLKQIVCLVMPLLLAQAVLAFWYVPIVFGEKWVHAIPVLAILCLSAIPRPLAESASALMLATGRITYDFVWNVLFTLLFVTAVSLAAQHDLLVVASSILFIYAITHPLYLWLAWNKTFNQQPEKISHAETVSSGG